MKISPSPRLRGINPIKLVLSSVEWTQYPNSANCKGLSRIVEVRWNYLQFCSSPKKWCILKPAVLGPQNTRDMYAVVVLRRWPCVNIGKGSISLIDNNGKKEADDPRWSSASAFSLPRLLTTRTLPANYSLQ